MTKGAIDSESARARVVHDEGEVVSDGEMGEGKPTVIWLIDPDESEGTKDASEGGEDAVQEERDGGKPFGQPI